MAAGVTIHVKGADELIRRLNKLGPAIQSEMRAEFQIAAEEVRELAIKKAPAHESGLRNSISAHRIGDNNYEVAVGKHYAPFVEFGTGRKFKAPTELGSYPSVFRNQRGGSFKDGLRAIENWVVRHKQYYNIKKPSDIRQAAYFTFMKILREGLRPQPYLFPAFFEVRKRLLERLKNIIKTETQR